MKQSRKFIGLLLITVTSILIIPSITNYFPLVGLGLWGMLAIAWIAFAISFCRRQLYYINVVLLLIEERIALPLYKDLIELPILPSSELRSRISLMRGEQFSPEQVVFILKEKL